MGITFATDDDLQQGRARVESLEARVAETERRLGALEGAPPPPPDPTEPPSVPIEPVGPLLPPPVTGLAHHAYFERHAPGALYAWSFRDQRMLDRPYSDWKGGPNGAVTYAPADDDYRDPQDAARFVIHPGSADLRNPVGSKPEQDILVPFDGRTVVISWDYYLGSEFRTENPILDSGRHGIRNHKSFWITHRDPERRGNGFLKLGTSYKTSFPMPDQLAATWWQTHVEVQPASEGGNVTRKEPFSPASPFSVAPNRWTRVWVAVKMEPAWQSVSAWIADEEIDAVPALDGLRLRVTTATDAWALRGLRLSFDSSQSREGGGRMVGYIRNLLITYADDPATMFERPVRG